ncbi:MAG: hypothetical protein LBH98_05880 [Chitinispirillales bacterium]|jgi:hypothetical protein|nr:hypothetical protein [Chitinispirillales bacterium]
MKKQKTKNIVIIIIIIFLKNSFCEDAAGFDFLNLPVSARSAGIGNISLIGESANVLAMRGNPAMLSEIKNNAVEIDFAPIILDVYSGALSGVIVLQNGLVVVPSIFYISFGTTDAVDENGDKLNLEIAPFSLSVDCAASYRFFERLSSGIRIKFVFEQIAKRTIYWDNIYCGAFALDLGIFSDYKALRYSAGLRNAGFSFDNYENINVKLPVSAFVAVGAILQKEAKIEWFLECEKYLYDYMFFRTGFEIPVFRDVLILRTGTIFSPNDVKNFFGTFGKSSKKSWEYSGENWILATVGATINAKIKNELLSIDIACQFRKDGIRPGLSFSGTMYF